MGNAVSLPEADGGPGLEWCGSAELKPSTLRAKEGREEQRERRRRQIQRTVQAMSEAEAQPRPENVRLKHLVSTSSRGFEDVGASRAATAGYFAARAEARTRWWWQRAPAEEEAEELDASDPEVEEGPQTPQKTLAPRVPAASSPPCHGRGTPATSFSSLAAPADTRKSKSALASRAPAATSFSSAQGAMPRSVSFSEGSDEKSGMFAAIGRAMSFHGTSNSTTGATSQRSRMRKKGERKKPVALMQRSRPMSIEVRSALEQQPQSRGRQASGARGQPLAMEMAVEAPAPQLSMLRCRALSTEEPENLPVVGTVRNRAQSFERGGGEPQTPRRGEPRTPRRGAGEPLQTPRRTASSRSRAPSNDERREPRGTPSRSLRDREDQPEIDAAARSLMLASVSSETSEMLHAAMARSRVLAAEKSENLPTAGTVRSRAQSFERGEMPLDVGYRRSRAPSFDGGRPGLQLPGGVLGQAPVVQDKEGMTPARRGAKGKSEGKKPANCGGWLMQRSPSSSEVASQASGGACRRSLSVKSEHHQPWGAPVAPRSRAASFYAAVGSVVGSALGRSRPTSVEPQGSSFSLPARSRSLSKTPSDGAGSRGGEAPPPHGAPGPPSTTPVVLKRKASDEDAISTGSASGDTGEDTMENGDSSPGRPSRRQESERSASPARSARALSFDADRSEQDRAWAEFAMRAESLVGIWGAEAPALFEVFRATADIRMAYATFAVLWRVAFAKNCQDGAVSQHRFPYQSFKGALNASWKAKKLWQLLDRRIARPEYRSAPCKGLRTLVVGAGPCGLRAAIELRLLGAEVVVVDRRVHFSRINQLHLWAWCGEELKALGARILEPPPSNFGANPDLLHVSISDLQKLLFKVALLLGVEVLLGTDFVCTEWNAADAQWQARLQPASASSMSLAEGLSGEVSPVSKHQELPSPAAPEVLRGISAVIVANGFGSSIGQTHGLQVVETQSLRQENAIGLVCNFKRSNGSAERNVRSFSMAAQFYMPLFMKLLASTGAELENMVYTKGQASHYFVMTPTHRCLIDAGVIMDRTYKPLLGPENIDREKLDAFIRKVTSFQFKDGEPAVLDAATEDLSPAKKSVEYADSGPRLFDFSKMRRHTEALAFVSPSAPADGEDEEGPNDLLVAVVGDALIEPFWPEGLGIVRGFFSVLDAGSAIAAWAGGASQTVTRRHLESAYQHLKTVGAATRSSVLKEDESAYALDPASRYRQFRIE